ncbi:MAG: hypothetical protein FWE80_10145, partial [Oscillospiraceae bacterium]|nr:hypothetical protein [Oscillospiraceae bacterium]
MFRRGMGWVFGLALLLAVWPVVGGGRVAAAVIIDAESGERAEELLSGRVPDWMGGGDSAAGAADAEAADTMPHG